ncbi:MAG TPA: N-acetylmuramic acid 6-phosphate etherase [Gaiellaceae bacterium]|jgi:N-acetylmuramic acid 6-phosphate etherase|nr:N-acetylmuramic acid 6-phosphate etherase [Gaiellaceae bacterium]
MTASVSATVGCSYFGVRILRHVARDLEDLARRGFTGVLHTFSENDLAYYRETMGQIVELSHELGLEVQMNPWGLGRTFGGEAESRFVTMRPEACQVLDDGRRVAAGCLNNPIYRSYCKEWADAALEAGADLVFWDEPHWVVPQDVGVDDASRWSCHCEVCRERFGRELPKRLTEEALAFREGSLVDFLREMVAHVHALGGRNTICVLPAVEGAHGIRDWDAVASLPGLDVFGTDPYWQVFREPAGEFVGRFASLAAQAASRAGVEPELWVPAFRLTRADIPDLQAAVDAARAAGIRRLWVWGYEACGHMSSLATPDSSAVWEAAVRALTGGTTEARREELADLDLRPTRELVRLMNREDGSVPGAVAAAADEIADAIDAIVERLARGGRLLYVGAGSSGRLAAVDAAECESTFSVSRVAAVVAESDAAEDDEQGGARELGALEPSADDAVVGISASGSTPYVLGALRAARDAGALTVALVSNARSPLASIADRELCVVVGPEFLAGSTRLKAGTAQKLVLNMLSTLAFVRLGKTFGNLMVDVSATNAKLRRRVHGIVVAATGVPAERAEHALEAAGGSAKVAIVSLLAGIDAEAARGRLAQANDNVRVALEAR